MKKNLYLMLIAVLALALIPVYNYVYPHAGAGISGYGNAIKLGLIIVAIIFSALIFFGSRNSENIKIRYFWQALSLFLIILLSIYFYLAYSWVRADFIL
ncbi:MAG: hypothetical protein KW788_01185 [Candidatus Doudnabacteria bacterium]|nr:hypothetical protein [Candidatus Doudnabacteria bacterium]